MNAIDPLREFVAAHEKLFVLTGAGVSTDSGIPDYRDADGQWKRQPPVTFQAFMGDLAVRKRYWARSMLGWSFFVTAQPNAAHRALAELERRGRIEMLLTQNVDGLHQRAGSTRVIDLHGRLDTVRCMDCEAHSDRASLQARLEQANPGWLPRMATVAPDGDADIEADFSAFAIPACEICGGTLKPDVVFFGENVPRERVLDAMKHLHASDAVLVVGSSLMVYSGLRFVHAAHKAGKPIAALNLGRTRADELLSPKIEAPIAATLLTLI